MENKNRTSIMTSRQFPYIIAGPCSIETQAQLQSSVDQLIRIPQVKLIRCGVWKPRTRPGGFEGLGETALAWIKEIKATTPQARFCCEVARPEHVAACQKYGIDAIWIGARTSGDPFSMNELTEAMRGWDIPVMVKNAPTPDVKTWIGAIERCCQVGLKQVSAVHRGFDIYNNMGFRNHPLWEIVLELRQAMPEIPILCDPSHIGGKREWIEMISQMALDINLDGLMIEVHPDPEKALTDAAQQITPAELTRLIDRLMVRDGENSGDNELHYLRKNIDHIDSEIIKLLKQRLDTSLQIAEVKGRYNMSAYQPKRWEEVLNNKIAQAKALGISETFIKEIYEKIHVESIRIQESGMRKME